MSRVPSEILWKTSVSAVLFRLHVFRNGDFLHALANFNQLRCAGLRMRFQTPAFCPLVRLIVVVDVAEQQAGPGAVDNDAKVAADANGPEVRVFRFVQFVELQAGMRGIQLQIERGHLRRLLFFRGQASQAVRKCVRNSEFHAFPQFTRNTFITSSPRWLMTFTAIRPDSGFSKGARVSLCSDSQASSLISAFSVVLSALYGSFAPRKYAWRTKKLSSL